MYEKKMLDEAIEEVKGAMHYAKCALKYKQECPTFAKRYFEMANDEMRHGDYLYKMAEEARAKKEYTDLEREFISGAKDWYAEEAAKAKHILEMYQM